MSMHFDPPYESPIENDFAWGLSKYLSDEALLKKQVVSDTHFGRFRIDFVAEIRSGNKVGYECDGREFHDAGRDLYRDALILDSGTVDSIIRIRGQDIVYRLGDVLYLISLWNPRLFSDRGMDCLERIASDRAKERHTMLDSLASVVYPEDSWNQKNPLGVMLTRSSRNSYGPGDGLQRQFVDFSKSIEPCALSIAIDRFREQLPSIVVPQG